MGTWIRDPVTAGGALAATFERGAIKLMVDDLLKGPEQDAKEEGSDDQTGIGAKPPSLQRQSTQARDVAFRHLHSTLHGQQHLLDIQRSS